MFSLFFIYFLARLFRMYTKFIEFIHTVISTVGYSNLDEGNSPSAPAAQPKLTPTYTQPPPSHASKLTNSNRVFCPD
jgi:hypothetical protein